MIDLVWDNHSCIFIFPISTRGVLQMSQKLKILNTLKAGRSLTEKQAVRRGIMNVRARITELRQDGHEIVNVPTKTGSKYVLGVSF